MKKMFSLSLLLNVVLGGAIVWQRCKKSGLIPTKPLAKEKSLEDDKHLVNPKLHYLAQECNAKLPPKYQGLIKILVEKDHPKLPAILQVGDIKISLKRENHIQSMFIVQSPLDAISMACYGYEGTGRYITVPYELEYILEHKDIINVYLKALGVEPISQNENYWTVSVEMGWNTGWKRFSWSVSEAYEKLHKKFKVRTPNGYHTTDFDPEAKLILLLKGWEHCFVEA